MTNKTSNGSADTAVTTKVLTRKVRFSYVHIFQPVANDEGGEKKYSVALLIPKSDTLTLTAIKNAIEAAKEIGRTSKWKGKIPPKLQIPLRDGDLERPEDEAYANCFFINAKSTSKPIVVDKDGREIIEADKVYSGCFGRASINFFPYDNKSVGIGAGLNNIQKLSDGPALSGRSTAAEDFAEAYVDDDEDDFM